MQVTRARLVARILTTTLLVAVCTLAFFSVVIPLLLGAQTYTVLTGSMKPTYEPGHLIAVRETPIEEITAGDVITFQIESGRPEVATHRVVGVGYAADGDRVLLTQGDANDAPDENPVQAVQLRGVVVYSIPWLGYLNLWATPGVKSIIVTVVGIGAIGWGVVVLLKDARSRRRVAAGTTAAAAALLLVVSPLISPAPAAVAADDGNPLLLSTDGETWTSSTALSIVDASERIVPGDVVPLELWVRNTSADAAEVAVSAEWSPSDPASASDAALAARLTAPDLPAQPIDAGADLRLPLAATLPATTGNEAKTGSATLTLTVSLVQTTADIGIPSAAADPLATTGGAVPTWLIAVAVVLVAAGIVLIIARAIVSARRNRRDP